MKVVDGPNYNERILYIPTKCLREFRYEIENKFNC